MACIVLVLRSKSIKEDSNVEGREIFVVQCNVFDLRLPLNEFNELCRVSTSVSPLRVLAEIEAFKCSYWGIF